MKSSSLIYRETKNIDKRRKINVYIELDDDCKNGHQDFSITGTLFEGYFGEIKDWGSIHDKILKYFPEYKIFVALHLCDYNGIHMHFISNLIYHLKNSPDKVGEYYGMNKKLVKRLLSLDWEDVNFVKYVIEKEGYISRRKNMANRAIKKLEKLCGKKFVLDSKISNYTLLTKEEVDDIEVKMEGNYYSCSERKKRVRTRINGKIKLSYEKEMKNLNIQQEYIDFKKHVLLICLNEKIDINSVSIYNRDSVSIKDSDLCGRITRKKLDELVLLIKESYVGEIKNIYTCSHTFGDECLRNIIDIKWYENSKTESVSN